MYRLPKLKSASGQTLLVVVLTISVSLIVVMSIIARSITDIKTSDQESDSLRAFSAAEAGVEKALIAGSQVRTNLSNGASYVAPVGFFAQGENNFINPQGILSGESLTVWFISHNADGTLKLSCGAAGDCYTGTSLNICWWDNTTNPPTSPETTPAVEITVYYATILTDLSTVKLFRQAYDPLTRNNFSAVDGGPSCALGATKFTYQKAITLLPVAGVGTPIMAKIRTWYNTSVPVKFGFQSQVVGRTFPAQGITVNSSGSAGESNREISVFQGYNDVPEVFESVLYSLKDIQKP